MKIDKSEVDFQRVEQCFRRSIDTYNQHAVVQRTICDVLFEMSRPWLPAHAESVLEIGAGTGLFTKKYLPEISINTLFLNDLVSSMEQPLRSICQPWTNMQTHFLAGDAQTIALPKADIVFSASTLQWFNHLPSFFERLHHSQKSDSLFIFSSFGPRNMIEVCTICKQGLNYVSTKDLINNLSTHYTILSIQEEQRTVWFDTATSVLHHLKKTGVNGLTPQRWTRRTLQQFETDYCRLYQSETGLSLTYHPIYVVCKAK